MQNRATRISKYKMINFDNYTNGNKTNHNPKRPYVTEYLYRTLIVGGYGSGKAALLNSINNQLYIDKIYLYAKDPWSKISIFD